MLANKSFEKKIEMFRVEKDGKQAKINKRNQHNG